MIVRYAGRCKEEIRERMTKKALKALKKEGAWFVQVYVDEDVEDMIRDAIGDYETKDLKVSIVTFVFVRAEKEEFDWDIYLVWLTDRYIEKWVEAVVSVGLADDVNVETEVIEEIARWFVSDLIVSGGNEEWLE